MPGVLYCTSVCILLLWLSRANVKTSDAVSPLWRKWEGNTVFTVHLSRYK